MSLYYPDTKVLIVMQTAYSFPAVIEIQEREREWAWKGLWTETHLLQYRVTTTLSLPQRAPWISAQLTYQLLIDNCRNWLNFQTRMIVSVGIWSMGQIFLLDRNTWYQACACQKIKSNNYTRNIYMNIKWMWFPNL